MLVHNSSHTTVIEIAFRARLSKPASLFLSCRRCHFNGWLLDFAGSVWWAYDSKPTLACRCQTCTQNDLLFLIAVNKVTGWQLLRTLGSLFCFSKSFSTATCSQLCSHPTQHPPQYENLGHIMCLHVWLLLTHTLFHVLLNLYFQCNDSCLPFPTRKPCSHCSVCRAFLRPVKNGIHQKTQIISSFLC